MATTRTPLHSSSIRWTLAFLACVVTLSGFAVTSRGTNLLHKADKLYENMAYKEALQGYHSALEEGAVNEHIYRRIGQCYIKLGEPQRAQHWYSLLVKYPGVTEEDILNYADLLKANREYEEADRWLEMHIPEGNLTAREQIASAAAALERLLEPSSRYKVFDAGVNTEGDEFSPAWVGNGKVLFSTSREHWGYFKYQDAWTGDPFTELYQASRDGEGNLYDSEPLNGGMNSVLNDGPAVCDLHTHDLYFTTNIWKNGNKVRELGIMRAESKGDHWQPVGPVWGDDDRASAFHPALSVDGKRMIFASDRPGGIGGADLYVSYNKAGKWSAPELLSTTVNTVRDELFPTLAADGRLFFASNGRFGLGGLDLFVCDPLEGGGFGEPENLGAPINSNSDDLGLIMDATGRNGYFTSNRARGKGGDDIYGFEVVKGTEETMQECAGVVIDAKHGYGRYGVLVVLCDEKLIPLDTVESGARGDYHFEIQPGRTYALQASLEGMHGDLQWIMADEVGAERVIKRDLYLLPEEGVWLRGVVGRCDNTMVMEAVNVTVKDLRTQRTEVIQSGNGGYFKQGLEADADYEVLLSADGHWSEKFMVSTGKDAEIIDLSNESKACLEPLQVSKPCALCLDNDPACDTRAIKLDRLAGRMMNTPEVEVEIIGYTGATGSGKETMLDLQKQLKAAVAVIVDHGVDRSHITMKALDAACETDGAPIDGFGFTYIVKGKVN
jgi:tetratricopeptide (TPR) repeat protein